MKLNAHKIRLILASKEITQCELAMLSGISRQSISTILSRGSCELRNAGRIARALNVDVSEIVEEG